MGLWTSCKKTTAEASANSKQAKHRHGESVARAWGVRDTGMESQQQIGRGQGREGGTVGRGQAATTRTRWVVEWGVGE